VRSDEDLTRDELSRDRLQKLLPLEKLGGRKQLRLFVGAGNERESERKSVEGGSRVEEGIESAGNEEGFILLRRRQTGLAQLWVGSEEAVDLQEGGRPQLLPLFHQFGQVGHVL
jgi:hypothetical protein